MAQLSDLQLASLLDEIAAAMKVDMPVVDAMIRLRDRRLGRVAKVAGQLADRLQRGESPAQAIRISDSPMVAQASATIEACERSGDPSLLSRVAAQLRGRHEQGRLARLAWLYPIMLLIIAYVVAVCVMAPIVRENHGHDFEWSPWLYNVSVWIQHSWWIPPLIGVFMVVATAAWLWTNRRMPKHVSRQLFCQSLADQIELGVPESKAISAAALMAGDSALHGQNDLTFESPKVKRLIAGDTLHVPAEIDTGREEMLIASLRYASAVHSERSRRYDYLWGRFIPRVTMVVAGAGLTLAYAWWVIRPIYQQVTQW